MPQRIAMTCQCCEIVFYAANWNDINHVTGDIGPGVKKAKPVHCAECRLHQGDAPEQELRRLRHHETRMREALNAATNYAVKAEAEVRKSREQVASALETRERAIEQLRKVQDIHTMKPDGSCTCGVKRDCRTGAVVLDRWTIMMMERPPRR